DHAVGCEQSSALGPLVEWPRQGVQHAHLAITLPEVWLAFELASGHRLQRNKRIAYRANAANPRGSQQGRKNLGKDVRMFVRIQVSHLEPGGLNLPYLRSDSRNQLIGIEPAQHGARGKGRKAGVELSRLRRANRQQRIHRVRW